MANRIQSKIGFILIVTAFLLISMLTSSVLQAFAVSDPAITVGTVSGKPGETVNVPVSISNNSGIVSLNVGIAYDSTKLKLASVTNGSVLSDPAHSGSLNTNPYKLSFAMDLSPNNVTTNGVIATLTFNILESAIPGDTEIAVDYKPSDIFDIAYNDIYFEKINGKVEIIANNIINAQTPNITTQPTNTTTINVGSTLTLSSVATIADGGVLSYQWYTNTTNNNTSGTPIDGATTANYQVPTLTAGTKYYYCIATNTNASVTGNKTASATSNVALVTINNIINAQTPTITVGSVSGKQGETISVPVSIANNSGIVSLNVSIAYDSSKLKLAGVTNGTVLSDPAHSGSLNTNPYKLSFAMDLSPVNITNNGVIATLKFEILSTANLGDSAVTVNYNPNDIYNLNLNNVYFEKLNGKIIISKGEEAASPQQTSEKPVPITNIPAAKIPFVPGGTSELPKSIIFKDGKSADVTWTSSNSAVVKLDARGSITAIGEGVVTLTARSADGKTQAITMVVAKPVTKLRTPLTTIYLKKGTSLAPPVCADSVNLQGKADNRAKLSYKSSNPKVATISTAGKIKAKKIGKTTITVTAQNGKAMKIKVNIVAKTKALKKLTLVKPPKTLKLGKTAQLKIKQTPAKATNLKVKFKTTGKSITVDAAGKITAVKKGKAKVTATIGKKKVVRSISVK